MRPTAGPQPWRGLLTAPACDDRADADAQPRAGFRLL